MGNSRSDSRVCGFYVSKRGCSKGRNCEFLHPTRGSLKDNSRRGGSFPQRLKPKACDFYNKPAGCRKGNKCLFIHMKKRVCQWVNTERGCRKGKYCDFLHTTEGGEDVVNDQNTGNDQQNQQNIDMDISQNGQQYQQYE